MAAFVGNRWLRHDTRVLYARVRPAGDATGAVSHQRARPVHRQRSGVARRYCRPQILGFTLQTETLIGLVLSLFGLLNSFGQPFTGRLSDRTGKRRVLVLTGQALRLPKPTATVHLIRLCRASPRRLASAQDDSSDGSAGERLAASERAGRQLRPVQHLPTLGFGTGPLVAGGVVTGGLAANDVVTSGSPGPRSPASPPPSLSPCWALL